MNGLHRFKNDLSERKLSGEEAEESSTPHKGGGNAEEEEQQDHLKAPKLCHNHACI